MIPGIRQRHVSTILIKSLFGFMMLGAFLEKSYAGSLINDNASQFVFNLDNDILFGTDREYTAGTHLKWTHHKINFNEWLFSPFFRTLDGQFSPKDDQIDQIILATEIFTLRATNGEQVQPVANTGWTYVAFRHIEAYKNQQLGMELNLGWIGPGSGGEEIQNGVHKLIGNRNETGWNLQYPDQPTINASISLQNDIKALTGKGFHSFYSLSSQLGNLRTNIGAGLGVSYASNCAPNFFNGFHSQLNTIKFGHGWGWFTYSVITSDYEIYNRLTDGRLFTGDKPIVRRRNFWPLFDIGIGFTYNQFSMNYSSKSTPQYYDDQPEKRFRYSSLNFHWGF